MEQRIMCLERIKNTKSQQKIETKKELNGNSRTEKKIRNENKNRK